MGHKRLIIIFFFSDPSRKRIHLDRIQIYRIYPILVNYKMTSARLRILQHKNKQTHMEAYKQFIQ